MPPPPVADPHATNVLDNAYGAPPHGNAAARIGHAAKRATAARNLAQTGNITEAELGEQEAFVIEESLATGIVGAPALPAGAPAWASAMFANVNNQFANVNNQFANVNNQFANMNNQLANIANKQTNAVASEHDDPIAPVTIGGVPLPGGFPNTYGELLALTPAQSLVFLNYYNLPPNPQATRNTRLRKFLGVK